MSVFRTLKQHGASPIDIITVAPREYNFTDNLPPLPPKIGKFE